MDGVAEVAGLLERYDACLAKYAAPAADYEKIGAEQAELEAKIQDARADDLDPQIEIAMAALRLPPGDANVVNLSGGEKTRVRSAQHTSVLQYLMRISYAVFCLQQKKHTKTHY